MPNGTFLRIFARHPVFYWLILVATALALTRPLYGQDDMPIKLSPMPPRSQYEAPAAKEAKSLVESTAASPKAYLTDFERSNYLETGTYDATVALWKKFEKASPFVKLLDIGRTPQGRTLYVCVVSKDKAFTPKAAEKTGKPVVFIQNGIHPGEISGKDATSMLLRDILVTKRHAAILDSVIILAMPVFNIDGHENTSPWHRINQNGPTEMGFRANANRLNLNRDYVKADAPEMRAWLRFYSEWLPDFLIDNHVTDGMDHQYDVTIDMPAEQNIWPTVGGWVKRDFLPKLYAAMEADGHIMGPYAEPRDEDWSKGMDIGVIEPRYSTSYAAIQNRPALLVETHSLKSHRTQTWSHYDIMLRSLEILGQGGRELRQVVRGADADIARLAETYNPRGSLFLAGTFGDEGTPTVYKGVKSHLETSEITGRQIRVYDPEPVDIPTVFFYKLKTTAAPSVPLGYLIPREWTNIIEVLEAHGVKLTRLKKPVTAQCETYRFSDAKWSPRPFESHLAMTAFKTARTKETRVYPAGTVWVPMNQRAARVAFNWLEPEGPDSAVRWGYFNAIFEQKEYFSDYVFEPIARELLKRNPKLKAEFEKKIAEDPQFAANPRERLSFLYKRTPYYEPDKDFYPVARVISPLD
jgi:hypothetical protein